jgi:conjugal transfer mating pair stabilization protein TraN
MTRISNPFPATLSGWLDTAKWATHLLLLSLFLSGTFSDAAECHRTGSTCIDSTASKNFSGYTIPVSQVGGCWEWRDTYECVKAETIDYCAALVTAGCNETASQCTQTDFNGACMKYQKTYRCADPVSPQPSNTVVLANTYTITEDSINGSACAGNKANSTCTLASHTCTDPGGTRNINGLDVTKDCWGWTDDYTCLGDRKNSCDDLEAKGCLRSGGKTCTDSIPNGTCQVWDVPYLCRTPGATHTQEDCSNRGFCINGQCFDSGHPPDADFARVVTMMEVAREAGNYLGDDLQVFKGADERCSIKLSGLKNCCKDKPGAQSNQAVLLPIALSAGRAVLDYGFQNASNYMYDFMFSKGNSWMTQKAVDAWGSGAWNPHPSTSMSFYGLTVSYTSGAGFAFSFDPYSFALQVGIYLLMQFLSCTEDEAYLAMKKGSRLCHYVGDYCAHKFLGYCYQRKQSYCCFNSRLARIIHEQGRPQIGKSWGGGDSPNCSGFTTDELGRLDFSKMDLSEFMAEVMANVKVPDASTMGTLIQHQSTTVTNRVNQYYQNGQGH